jgi:hypothetical protein
MAEQLHVTLSAWDHFARFRTSLKCNVSPSPYSKQRDKHYFGRDYPDRSNDSASTDASQRTSDDKPGYGLPKMSSLKMYRTKLTFAAPQSRDPMTKIAMLENRRFW